ncbi:MAG: Trypsin-like peptidase domain [Pseudomonadota bacterium]|jgi:hypothetical protein
MNTSAELLDAHQRMAELIPGRRNRFGALGFGIGRRMAAGRVTGERALVVLVPRKSREPEAALPRRVPGTRIPIDVLALGTPLEPDEPLSLPEDPGTLAAASPLGLSSGVWHSAAGFGLPFDAPEYLVTVRHPFADLPAGTPVFSHRRRIGQLVSEGTFCGHDLALVRLAQSGELAATVPSGEALSGSGAAQFLHLGAPLQFYSPVRGTLLRPRVIAIRVTVFLLAWGGGATVQQERMVMTERATSPGDSGAPLFDDDGTVLGLASFRTDRFSFFEGVGHGRLQELIDEGG